MSPGLLSGSQITAARVLVGISKAKLTLRSGVDREILDALEAAGVQPLDESESLAKVRLALEDVGAVFIDEADGAGAGVRLKFSRAQARAIGRWEGEGGVAADDEVP